MKRQLFAACFAVLAATPASALNPYAQSPAFYTRETGCSSLHRDAETQIRDCTEALRGESRPEARHALLADLGVAYARAARFNMAMDCFAQVLSSYPDDWQVLLARGTVYMQIERPKEALDDADRALRVKPDFAPLRVLRGGALAMQGKFEAAILDIDAAIALSPDDAAGYNVRGMVHGRMGQPALALADYDRAIALSPAPQFYNNRCFERATQGSDLAGALADCNKALEQGADAQFLDSRGFVYFRMGAYKAALADYDAALGKRPGYASSLYMRGMTKQKAGDAKGGDIDIAAANAADAKIAARYASYGVTP